MYSAHHRKELRVTTHRAHKGAARKHHAPIIKCEGHWLGPTPTPAKPVISGRQEDHKFNAHVCIQSSSQPMLEEEGWGCSSVTDCLPSTSLIRYSVLERRERGTNRREGGNRTGRQARKTIRKMSLGNTGDQLWSSVNS